MDYILLMLINFLVCVQHFPRSLSPTYGVKSNRANNIAFVRLTENTQRKSCEQ
jgi:hypothetical protein